MDDLALLRSISADLYEWPYMHARKSTNGSSVNTGISRPVARRPSAWEGSAAERSSGAKKRMRVGRRAWPAAAGAKVTDTVVLP